MLGEVKCDGRVSTSTEGGADRDTRRPVLAMMEILKEDS